MEICSWGHSTTCLKKGAAANPSAPSSVLASGQASQANIEWAGQSERDAQLVCGLFLFVWRMFELNKSPLNSRANLWDLCGCGIIRHHFLRGLRKDILLHPNVTWCFLTRSCMKVSRSSSTTHRYATRATECWDIGEHLWCNFDGPNGSGAGAWCWKFCSFAMSEKVEAANRRGWE